jgi:hypothetical protein
MRIILTEDQMKVITLIKEQSEFVAHTMDAIKQVKKNANSLYNLITFTTIAEIIDGDLDIGSVENKVTALDDNLNVIARRVSEYFDRFSQDEYSARNLDDVHLDLEGRISDVNKKINVLYDFVKHLSPFGKDDYDNGWNGAFDDIKSVEI